MDPKPHTTPHATSDHDSAARFLRHVSDGYLHRVSRTADRNGDIGRAIHAELARRAPQPGRLVQVRRTVNGRLVAVAKGTVARCLPIDNDNFSLELIRADERGDDGFWHIGTTHGRLTGQTVVTTVELADAGTVA